MTGSGNSEGYAPIYHITLYNSTKDQITDRDSTLPFSSLTDACTKVV